MFVEVFNSILSTSIHMYILYILHVGESALFSVETWVPSSIPYETASHILQFSLGLYLIPRLIHVQYST